MNVVVTRHADAAGAGGGVSERLDLRDRVGHRLLDKNVTPAGQALLGHGRVRLHRCEDVDGVHGRIIEQFDERAIAACAVPPSQPLCPLGIGVVHADQTSTATSGDAPGVKFGNDSRAVQCDTDDIG